MVWSEAAQGVLLPLNWRDYGAGQAPAERQVDSNGHGQGPRVQATLGAPCV